MFGRLTAAVAWLVLVYAVIAIWMGFYLADEGRHDLAQRYFALQTTGAVIDRGFKALLLALVLGTLAEIAEQTRAVKSDGDKERTSR